MTPLAAQIFRAGDEISQRQLAGSQFFECTAIADLASEMRLADGWSTPYSIMAQLPAKSTILESMLFGKRFMFACTEDADGDIGVHCVAGYAGAAEHCWGAYFRPGTAKYQIVSEVDIHTPAVAKEKNSILIGLFFVEKLLCIINQPGLIEKRERDTDKRVMRQASGLLVPPKWHECRIRPGYHAGPIEMVRGEGRGHQLHYVRKYFKPSIQKWVEGYWRGDADLGIYLKHYNVQAPAAQAAA